MLTRDEQDAILVPITVAYREVHREMFGSYPPASEGTNDELLRAALRLDDKSLDHAIAWSAHKHPWQSTVPERGLE